MEQCKESTKFRRRFAISCPHNPEQLKMSLMKWVIFMLVLWSTSSAHAQLGKAPAEVVKRWGQPTKINEEDKTLPEMVFVFSTLRVTATFIKGKCARLDLWKLDKSYWDDAAIQAALYENRPPGFIPWQRVTRKTPTSTWESGSGPGLWRAHLIQCTTPGGPTTTKQKEEASGNTSPLFTGFILESDVYLRLPVATPEPKPKP